MSYITSGAVALAIIFGILIILVIISLCKAASDADDFFDEECFDKLLEKEKEDL